MRYVASFIVGTGLGLIFWAGIPMAIVVPYPVPIPVSGQYCARPNGSGYECHEFVVMDYAERRLVVDSVDGGYCVAKNTLPACPVIIITKEEAREGRSQ